MVAPESATLLPLFAPVTVPPQVVAALALAVLTKPAGYVSVNAALVAAVPFGFASVIVITLVSLVPMVVGAKDFVTAMTLATVSVSLAGAVLDAASVVVSAPAAIVFT